MVVFPTGPATQRKSQEWQYCFYKLRTNNISTQNKQEYFQQQVSKFGVRRPGTTRYVIGGCYLK
jgi:hypothetical protein